MYADTKFEPFAEADFNVRERCMLEVLNANVDHEIDEERNGEETVEIFEKLHFGAN